MKKRVVVVCPGRGTYTKETLGYLKQFGSHDAEFISDIDQKRRELNEPTVSALDSAEIFKAQVHTKGENASTLIYACAHADFMAIDRDQFEIVAVTGNSMGWYLTLAFGGGLDQDGAFAVINTMGSMMKDEIVGGQVIYPMIDENWRVSPQRVAEVESIVNSIRLRPGHEVYDSIYLGGYRIWGANRPGINALLKELPALENYPFQLINHAAFHTPLLNETSDKAFTQISSRLFEPPTYPLIDGRGHIWQPFSTNPEDLYQYTLGQQVVAPYDFTKAISVALKEFVPDGLILLGPGSSLGGATAQILIENDWLGINSKAEFQRQQEEKPFILAMGRPEQRNLVVSR